MLRRDVVASFCPFRLMVEASCISKMNITGMASTGQRLAAQLALPRPVLQLSWMIDFLCLFQCHNKRLAAIVPCVAFSEL